MVGYYSYIFTFTFFYILYIFTFTLLFKKKIFLFSQSSTDYMNTLKFCNTERFQTTY